MVVERKPDTWNYNQIRMSVSEWQEYAYQATYEIVGSDYKTISTTKKVTNPPNIYEHTTWYLTVNYFCEDGQYAVPTAYLEEGIESTIQTRTLIGITEGENVAIKGG